jgi:large subunit ribosomal protein L23
MKLSDVLIKPILSEKANKQAEKMNRYAFVVDRKANKLEIKRAVEAFYGVQVEEVNTMVMPSKLKAKYTKAGFIVGDLVLSVNNDFSKNLQRYKTIVQTSTEKIKFLVDRNGEYKLLTLKTISIL